MERISLRSRFFNAIEISSDCWIWTKCVNAADPNGYGLIVANGKRSVAHRVSWELHYGPIPNGLSVLHRCDIRRCVNPAHLFLGTRADNMRDMSLKGRSHRAFGEDNPTSKLTAAAVAEIRAIGAARGMKAILARKYGVSHCAIRKAFGRVTWIAQR